MVAENGLKMSYEQIWVLEKENFFNEEKVKAELSVSSAFVAKVWIYELIP